MAITTPEQRAAAQVRRERRPFDGLFQFQPTPKQLQFIRSVLDDDEPYESWFCASNRSGKTISGCYCGAVLARYGTGDAPPAVGPHVTVRDRATSGWVVGPSFAVLRDTIMPLYFDNGFVSPTGIAPFIPAYEVAHFDWGSQVLKLTNGSIIGFRSNEQDTMKFASAGKDWEHFDEQPERRNYIESTLRIAAGRRLRIFGTATLLPPENEVGGISWIYDDIIRPWLAKTRTDVAVFGASIYENPHLLPAEIARLESRYPLGSIERRIRLDGEWLPGIAGDMVYGNFEPHLHVKVQGQPVPTRPLVLAMDFNVSPFCALVGQQAGTQFRVLREFCLDHGSIQSMLEAFRAAYPSHAHELWLYGDATGGARHVQTGLSDWRVVLEYLRGYPAPVKLKVPEANPHVHARVGAVNMALQDHEGLVSVTIDPGCTELILDLERVLSDGHGGILKVSSAKDAYSRRTHMSDALGYWISAVRPVGSAKHAARGAIRVPSPSYGGVPHGPRAAPAFARRR